MTTLDQFPKEIILHVASFLPAVTSCSKAIPNLAQSCKYLNACVHPLLFHSHSDLKPITPDSPASDKIMEHMHKYNVCSLDRDLQHFPNVKYLGIAHVNCVRVFDTAPFFRSVTNQYTHLDAIHLAFIMSDINCESLLSALTEICNVNVSLSKFSIVLFGKWTISNNEGVIKDSENLAAAVSQLKYLKTCSVLANSTFQIPTLPAVIFNAFAESDSLRELDLRMYSSSYGYCSGSIQKVLRRGVLKTLKLDGEGLDSESLKQITECGSLSSLSLKLLPTEVEEFFRFAQPYRLPLSTTLSIAKDESFVDLGELDFNANFEGAEYLKISSSVPLPACLYRGMSRSTTLWEIDLDVCFYNEGIYCPNLTNVINSMEKLTTLKVNLDLRIAREDYDMVFTTLELNRYIKVLDLEAKSMSDVDYARIKKLLMNNSSVEILVFSLDMHFDLECVLKTILENPTSAIKLVMIKDRFGRMLDVVTRFDRNNSCRGLVLQVRQFPGRDTMHFAELIKVFICNWIEERGVLVDQIALDALSHYQYKRFCEMLEIKELIWKNDKIKLGYSKGSFCLWYNKEKNI
ncbi:hypothetical protein HK098_002583 [Nowakowskiella sp. JEL0407]|nr:hypothetical protein HK098_002583 [Nowakowskiella sp. JEL0407]